MKRKYQPKKDQPKEYQHRIEYQPFDKMLIKLEGDRDIKPLADGAKAMASAVKYDTSKGLHKGYSAEGRCHKLIEKLEAYASRNKQKFLLKTPEKITYHFLEWALPHLDKKTQAAWKPILREYKKKHKIK